MVAAHTGWTFVEPCCGSGAMTLHLLGARQALVPYAGSKWSLRRELAGVLLRLGAWGQPSRVVLSDASWWAGAVAAVLRDRAAVADALRPLVRDGEQDPAGQYERLREWPVPVDPALRTAVLLWLQRMSFSGKAVGDVEDAQGRKRWVTHGLNATSAYGRAGTDRFGEVRPLGATLLEAVEAAPQCRAVEAKRGLVLPHVDGPTVVLLDPPYAGTSGYPTGDLSRDDVVAYALQWQDTGAWVVVCEAEPVGELLARGWRAERLRTSTRRSSRQPFRRATRGEEWVTVSPHGRIDGDNDDCDGGA